MKLTNEQIKDKIYGSIIGFAVGDAFALSTEGMTTGQIRDKYCESIISKMYGGGLGNWSPGQFSDDTEMMIAIGQAAQYHTGNFAQALLRWRDSNPADIGIHMRKVFERVPQDEYYMNFEDIMLKAAADVEKEHEGLGNGSLGRALVPIIIDIFDAQCDEEKSSDIPWFVKQSLLTHQNQEVTDSVLQYRLYMALMKDEVDLSISNEKTTTVGTAKNTLRRALMQLHLWEIDIYSAIRDITTDGGDSDSIAAVYGSLWGMRYGFKKMIKAPRVAEWILTMLTANNRGDILALCKHTSDKCILKNTDKDWYKK